MKCPKCQTDNSDASRYCGNCATQLTRPAEAPPGPTVTLAASVQVLRKGSLLAQKYRVIEEIGRGGMGVVYRAHDDSIDRDVAVKVLPPQFASDADRLRRFEQEAKAAGQLNHPNILVVYEVGAHQGAPYIVTELLEGESLRDRLRAGALPARKAAEITAQIGQGLAAAHEKHVVHRDLKPENVFLTKDGRVKILDFGLAKLTARSSREGTEGLATLTETTEAGTVLGTVGYMSPEQVLGRPLDARSDLFSLGVMLYEMIAGKRPFQKDSAPETMAAILKEEAPGLDETGKTLPPGLDPIVRHCLEKEPSRRFQSARDIVFALESLSQVTKSGPARPPSMPVQRRRAVVGLVLLAGSYGGLYVLARRPATAPVPTFKRITFQRGTVQSARFAPDFQSIVYSAAWDGRPAELFLQRVASADAPRSLGVVDTTVTIAGTAGGDVAVLRESGRSTLTQLPLEGGPPRDLLEGILGADRDRSRDQFAVVRRTEDGRGSRLEYPVGKVLVEARDPELIARPRVSPDGTRIAYILKPEMNQNAGGDICVVDREGRKRTLSKNWTKASEGPPAWSPDGKEIWFSASRTWHRNELRAVALSGKERLVTRLPGNLVLQDIAPDGRALFVFGQTPRAEQRGRMAGDAAERDLSWLDFTYDPILAPDGTQMIFQSESEARGEYSTYHWRMDGSTPKWLGTGQTVGVSPDWTTALVTEGPPGRAFLKLVPIDAGETRTLPLGPAQSLMWAYWHPDGKRLVIFGYDAEGHYQMFVQEVSGGLPRPVRRFERAIGWAFLPISPDGRFIALRLKPGDPYVFCPFDGGETEPIPYLKAGERPLAFGDDGQSIFVVPFGNAFPAIVTRLDLRSGRREPWLELAPPDRAGVKNYTLVKLTVNGRYYSYLIQRQLSDLYLAEGLK